MPAFHLEMPAGSKASDLYSLANVMTVGILHIGQDGNIVYANPAVCTMIGLSGVEQTSTREERKKLPQKTFLDSVHPEDKKNVLRLWQRIKQHKTEETLDFRYLKQDSSSVWVHSHFSPLADDSGHPGFVCSLEDISLEVSQRQKIERLSRFNTTTQQIISQIPRCRDEESLYAAVCRIAVEHGGFSAATITTYDPEHRRLSLVCHQGKWLDIIRERTESRIVKDPMKSLRAKAILTGRSVFTSNFAEYNLQGFADRAASQGTRIGSSAAIPIGAFGRRYKALGLFASDPNYFDQDIMALTNEIQRDICFGLENLHREHQRHSAEKALRRNEEQLRLASSLTGLCLYEINLTENTIWLDESASRTLALTEGDTILPLRALYRYIQNTDDVEYYQRLPEDYRSGKINHHSIESLWLTQDGTRRWLRNAGGKIGNENRVLGFIQDVTEEHQEEEQYRLASAMFESSNEAIVITDMKGIILMLNPGLERMTGYTANELVGHHVSEMKSSRKLSKTFTERREALAEKGTWQGEIYIRTKNGVDIPVLENASIVRDRHGNATHCVRQAIDITEQKEFQRRISYLAYRDALTDLPNRTLLRERVEQSMAIAKREGLKLAVLFLDLDLFKNINDSLGHNIGDRLLVQISQRLRQNVRDMDTVGRLGGDEFLILLFDVDPDGAAQVAQKVLNACARNFICEKHELNVTSSLGIAMYPKDGESFDELLRTADTAMYHAKEKGRNSFSFFTDEMNDTVFRRMTMENSLRKAVESKSFSLCYQPKYCLKRQRILGLEALIRWRHPELGEVPPDQFISIAEDCGLIQEIGQWVLQESISQLKTWRALCGYPLHIAVNFSVRQLAETNIVDKIDNLLQKANLPSDALEIELTESLLATNSARTLNILRALKQREMSIAIDDFGTGYSSLSYLKQFPIDRLKIDKSFVRDLETDESDRAIAKAIVALGHSLGMTVIAEGVENAAQLEILKAMGCDEGQGFFLAAPMNEDEVARLLKAHFEGQPLPNHEA